MVQVGFTAGILWLNRKHFATLETVSFSRHNVFLYFAALVTPAIAELGAVLKWNNVFFFLYAGIAKVSVFLLTLFSVSCCYSVSLIVSIVTVRTALLNYIRAPT